MSKKQIVVLLAGLLIYSGWGVHAMDLVLDHPPLQEQKEVDKVLLDEIAKAQISMELRECLANYQSNKIALDKFMRLISEQDWLIDYRAGDDLTIGEYIVTLCKNEYDRMSQLRNIQDWLISSYSWNTPQGPYCLLAPFEHIMQVFVKRRPQCVTHQLSTSDNTLNKIRLCTIGHKGAEPLITKMNSSFLQRLTFCPTAVHNARQTLQLGLDPVNEVQFEVTKKAHGALEFLSLFQKFKLKEALAFLKENVWLAQSKCFPSNYGPQLLSLLDLFARSYTDHNWDNQTGRSLIAHAVFYGAGALTKEEQASFAKFSLIRDFIDHYMRDNDDFKNCWLRNDVDPSFEQICREMRLEELRTLAATDSYNFGKRLEDDLAFLDIEGSDKLTLGEYIVNEYRRNIGDTIESNKGKKLTKEDPEATTKATNLSSSFNTVLSKCQDGSDRLFKIDRQLFYFYSQCASCPDYYGIKPNEWCNYSETFSFNEGPSRTYKTSPLHRERENRRYGSGYNYNYSGYSNYRPGLGHFYTNEHTYTSRNLPFVLVTPEEKAQREAAQKVCAFFAQIDYGRFDMALEVLQSSPWLARMEKPDYSKVDDWDKNGAQKTPNNYKITPLYAIAKKLNALEYIDDEDKRDAHSLFAYLLIYGADPALRTTAGSLRDEMTNYGTKCGELAQILANFNNFDDRQKVYSLCSSEFSLVNSDLESDSESDEELDDSDEEVAENLALDEEEVVLVSGGSWKATVLKAMLVGASCYTIGKLLARKAAAEKQNEEENADQENESSQKKDDATDKPTEEQSPEGDSPAEVA